MSVLIIIDMQAKPGKGDELVAMFKAIVPDTRAFDGCEQVAVFRNQDDPDQLSIVETFTTRAQYDAYFNWRLERGDLGPLVELIVAPPAPRFLDDIGA